MRYTWPIFYCSYISVIHAFCFYEFFHKYIEKNPEAIFFFSTVQSSFPGLIKTQTNKQKRRKKLQYFDDSFQKIWLILIPIFKETVQIQKIEEASFSPV